MGRTRGWGGPGVASRWSACLSLACDRPVALLRRACGPSPAVHEWILANVRSLGFWSALLAGVMLSLSDLRVPYLKAKQPEERDWPSAWLAKRCSDLDLHHLTVLRGRRAWIDAIAARW